MENKKRKIVEQDKDLQLDQWKITFNPEKNKYCLKDNFMCVIYSPSQGGKTTLLRALLWQIRKHYDYIIIMSKNGLEEDLNYMCYKNHYFEDYNPSFLKFIYNENIKRNQKTGKFFKYLIVLDDQINYPHFHEDVTLKSIFTEWRHKGFSCILLVQFATSIAPHVRSNANEAILFKADANMMRYYYEHYSGSIRSQVFFKDFIDYYTDEYGVIIYHGHCGSLKPKNQFNNYRTPKNFIKRENFLYYMIRFWDFKKNLSKEQKEERKAEVLLHIENLKKKNGGKL